MQILVKNLTELAAFAEDFTSKLILKKDRAVVIGLSGELGSGKTSFVQECAKALGITERITSPTFVVMKKFEIPFRLERPNRSGGRNSKFGILTHIDAYRLKSGEEIKNLGWDEMLADPQNLILVEWPENIADILPLEYQKISFEFISENERRIRTL